VESRANVIMGRVMRWYSDVMIK